jgi:hypothetical protein
VKTPTLAALNLQWVGEDSTLASVFCNGLVKTPTLAANFLKIFTGKVINGLVKTPTPAASLLQWVGEDVNPGSQFSILSYV